MFSGWAVTASVYFVFLLAATLAAGLFLPPRKESFIAFGTEIFYDVWSIVLAVVAIGATFLSLRGIKEKQKELLDKSVIEASI